MTDPFKDNVVIITGASSGIGRQMASQLADRGALLALGARDQSRLEAVAAACRERGGTAIAIQTDVTEDQQCRRLIDRTVHEYGRLDTLINNAGISMMARFDDLRDLTLPARVMNVNYLGCVYCTFYAIPHLKKTQGRIVGISSLTGLAGVPMRTVYAASKHAMAGLFDSLRIELMDHGVSVTMAYPDFVETEVRDRALGADGQPVGIYPAREGEFMSAEACARAIINASGKRKREVIMSLRGRVGHFLKVVAPGLVDRMAKRAMERVQGTP